MDEKHGISDATRDEAEVKKAMIKASEEVYFLMDHHKLASRAFYRVCGLEEITELIVDASDDEYVTEFAEECRKNNKRICCV